MSKRILLLLTAIIFCKLGFSKDAYNISITIKGFKNRNFYLGYYYGDKQYLRDSAKTDATGKMVFKGSKPLEGGVYLIATADKSLLFDFIVTEQFFELEATDTTNIAGSVIVKNSKENEAFFQYQKFSVNLAKQANELDAKTRQAKNNGDTASVSKLTKEMDELQDKIFEYRKGVIAKDPSILISKIFKLMQEIDVPEPPKLANGSIDSTFQYYYYLNHYFDNTDLKDDRITRTPVYFAKFEKYITKILPQIPDSINKYCDVLLNKSTGANENYKFNLYWITNHYEESKFMGMDAVFVHMIDEHYAKGRAYWIDSTMMFKMKDRANRLRYNLIGKKSLNLSMPDTNNVYHSLFNTNSKYTLLAFWDATCGHCKEEMPKIVRSYDSLNAIHKSTVKAQKFLEVYSVSGTPDPKDWKKYIAEMKHKWISVYDPNNETNFRYYYDIYSTPVFYLLNDKKEILAKRLTPEQIVDMIDKMEKQKKF
jgi:thiol-disulfide isomerase/thioredoxin